MRNVTIYESFDGQRFETADLCKAHEAQHVETRLVGLTIEQVRAALARDDVDLADAIEEIGNRITKTRLAAGERRRARNGESRAQEAAPEPPSERDEKLAEATRRARNAGLQAGHEGKPATVPKAWATAAPLADAWLDGHRQGAQARQVEQPGAEAA